MPRSNPCSVPRPSYERGGTLRLLACGALLGTALSGFAGTALAADITWNGSNASYNTGTNWTPTTVPGAGDTAFFGATGTAVIGATGADVGGWTFNPGAQAYDITTGGSNFRFLGAGIVINGGSVVINNQLSVQFLNSSTAGSAIIDNGATGTVNFANGSSAGSADIVNDNDVSFADTSDAGTATITNNDDLIFDDTSNAGSADITNNGGLRFYLYSDAGSASIDNNFNLEFFGNASAGDATIDNSATGAVSFFDDANAGSATITNDFVVQFADGSTAGTATITNNGDLQFDSTSNAGSAVITNNATLLFRLNSSAGSATITNNATIEFAHFSNAGTAQLINNAGTIDLSGTSGANNDGQLTAGSIEGAGGILLGSNALTVGSNNLSTSVGGAITGVGGSLVKVGTGALTLNATDKAYTGATSVNAGMLVVNTGLATSGVTVASGARLGGGGTITGTATINGVIAPGNSIGTINTGSITFGVGSRYEVEISPTQSDHTNVTGTATINGGTVQVIAGAGTYSDGTVYTILSSSGARTGTFSSVTDNLAFFTPVLSYDANNVYLTLAADGTFQTYGTSSNRSAIATSLDAMGTGAPYHAQLQGLTTDEVAPALDALSGEAHASIKSEFLAQSQMLADAAFGRMDQNTDAVDTAGVVSGYVAAEAQTEAKAGTELWGNLYGSIGFIRANGNAAETTSATGGVLFGHDVQLDSGWTAGVLAGAGLTSINARNTSANSADFSFGVFGGRDMGVIELKVGAAYTRHQINSRRTIAFPGVNEVMTANYAANSVQGFTEVSKTFEHGAIDVTPFARLDLLTHATDAFTETGGAGALSSAESRNNAAFTTLGVRVADSFVVGETMLLRAEGSLGWRHAFADLPSTTNSFAGGTPFTVSGAPVASDALALNGTLSFDVSENLDLALSYDGQLSTSGASHALKLAAAGTF